MWDRPRSGIESTSPALAGRFFTTEPPEKPFHEYFQPMVDWSECTENTWWAAARGRAAGRRGSWERKESTEWPELREGGCQTRQRTWKKSFQNYCDFCRRIWGNHAASFFKKKKEEIIKRVIQRLWEERSGFLNHRKSPLGWASRQRLRLQLFLCPHRGNLGAVRAGRDGVEAATLWSWLQESGDGVWLWEVESYRL